MTVPDPRYVIASAAMKDGSLAVHWQDGHQSHFHPHWLRHQCGCSHCGTAITAVRGIRLHHIPEDITARLEDSRDDAVVLAWSPDEHRSRYAARWLRDHCYSDAERARRKHRPLLWDRRIGNGCPRASMARCERDPETRLALL